MDEILFPLAESGYSVILKGFSAIDLYLELPAMPFLFVETDADISVLARLIDKLRFPGVEIADAAADTFNGTCYFRCPDMDEKEQYSFPLLSFGYNWKTHRFKDPLGMYPVLKNLRQKRGVFTGPSSALPNAGRYRIIMDASLLLARYGFEPGALKQALSLVTGFFEGYKEQFSPESPLGPEMQRAFLSCLLISPRPDLALEFLKHSGLLQELWPELACLDEVDHSKEFHPEGNVWNHTLETFRYRKPNASGDFDLRLSLALLLHDTGKPISASFGNHRFDGHAELGARAAARFLNRLEFKTSLVQDIFFLVKNHMLPAALKRLPLIKTSEIMASPLFPVLMELYRCDESSSFKGLDGYYENSAAYRAYLKNLKNPYRSADGKKIGGKKLKRKFKSPTLEL